jgi:hypothetical protein
MWCDFADTMVVVVSHNDVAAPIHCDSTGPPELRNGPFSILMPPHVSACQSGHFALLCDLADSMAPRVSHNDISVVIHCDSNGQVELRDVSFYI